MPGGDLRKALTPFVGMSGGVKHAIDRYRVFCVLVEHRIRKAAHQRPAIVLVGKRMHLRCTANGFHAGINTTKKFFTQAGAATLIPSVGFSEVLFRLRGYDPSSGHSGCEPCV